MKKFTYTNGKNVITIYAANQEAADAKLEKRVPDPENYYTLDELKEFSK